MKCYLKCGNHGNHDNVFCNKNKNEDWANLNGHRICTPDGYACQVQCLTTQMKGGNHEKALIGAEHLKNDFNISVAQSANASLEYY